MWCCILISSISSYSCLSCGHISGVLLMQAEHVLQPLADIKSSKLVNWALAAVWGGNTQDMRRLCQRDAHLTAIVNQRRVCETTHCHLWQFFDRGWTLKKIQVTGQSAYCIVFGLFFPQKIITIWSVWAHSCGEFICFHLLLSATTSIEKEITVAKLESEIWTQQN